MLLRYFTVLNYLIIWIPPKPSLVQSGPISSIFSQTDNLVQEKKFLMYCILMKIGPNSRGKKFVNCIFWKPDVSFSLYVVNNQDQYNIQSFILSFMRQRQNQIKIPSSFWEETCKHRNKSIVNCHVVTFSAWKSGEREFFRVELRFNPSSFQLHFMGPSFTILLSKPDVNLVCWKLGMYFLPWYL